jgi:hypothetical protein
MRSNKKYAGEDGVKCNRGCGDFGLHWRVVNGKYKLFSNDNLIHMCNDGEISSKKARERVTKSILFELGIDDTNDIPRADYEPKSKPYKSTKASFKEPNGIKETTIYGISDRDPKKMFTINSTASGIAITGDDKHNAIYIPKVAITELTKALVDFIC